MRESSNSSVILSLTSTPPESSFVFQVTPQSLRSMRREPSRPARRLPKGSDSTATVVIETASVDTRSEDRDTHLRSADFFDVETYPQMRFVSSAIDEVDEGSYIVTGELTIRDMTKTVSVPLELIGVDTDPFGNLRAGLEGSRRIDRKDWGVTWNTKLDSGGVLVSDKITLEFELSLIKNVAEATPTATAETDGETAATDASETSTSETADEQLPPPPPIKPDDKPQQAEAQSTESQSAEKPRGSLFGLR